ncbi:hypothetical protein O1611_g3816 [Lasiodiplodia mahajangana]|uniref:Uncharacterized protein n=1 Tax=Lasiodiplodia mahajangana TaxID=1108764 RepID=A0ACC2JQL3_9PEZI|nr:hypothetical protein O1611_g3816 [Lasiodiplodia mahajangana]
MKRKEPPAGDTVEQTHSHQSGRRQPQTSCVNCRVKKIKCDRGVPCASCTVRGISCTGQPGPKPVTVPQFNAADSGTNASILSRLASLERAVFGDARHADAANGNAITKSLSQYSPATSTSTQATAINTPSPSFHKDTERQQAAKFLDLTYTRDDHSVEQGYEGDPTAAALMLSIASTSASFFNNYDTTHTIFTSTEAATEASVVWRQTALTILDDPHFPTVGSLESCQARAILAYSVCNVEGCSARYRLLHSCSVAIARDISLHLIDSTVTTDTSDDAATREIKRRLWWHLAATDWLLGLVGGPLDGTYTIQPRHFVVNRPRNLNDNDLSQSDEKLTYPLNVITNVSCFLQRIRLGEICREMMDARAPRLLDVEITDFNTVMSLDSLFERVLAEMPPFLRKGAPIPEGAPLHTAQQRDLVLLCFNFRRARLHRPFLLHDTDNPRNEPSRRQCISSARTVLSLSIDMLEGPSAVGQNHDFGNPLAYRTGLVISGMFMACAILALNAGIIWSRSTGDARANAQSSDASEEMRGEITRACRVLAKAGEKSTFAANLLRNLVGVLKQYSMKEIDDLVSLPTTSNPNTECNIDNNDMTSPTCATRGRSQSIGDTVNLADNYTMWNDFFATMPEMEGYDQLFAGLDYYCGPT